MRNMIRVLVLMSVSVGILSACGPAEDVDVTPPAIVDAQVEQEIGDTPHCQIGGSIQSQIIWADACKACTEVGGDGSWPRGAYGRPGSLHQRCCYGTTCGAWKLIRPVCETCELH
ncbi:hypothetical protein G4177_27305 [Corallococcus sp. ZKHCc1 1396]|uniref:Lipoprotein n=1 Tax=Corallococcus soli TaxID=2710757 RepID=A0ABR9PVS2_9BACT|nr:MULTISPECIES: hypothetical protein [Corallococcus]MBE4751882.1 hypothetical protein [Corallococcus soli]MCY1034591.1 hypothetical protein [Corallococcus sp. BB11-1]RYZ46553.1 MAG: hypothetical protein EOO72_01675 [Myxococcaceae bacterium]